MDAKSQPLVSVVTPVYNGEKYLADCIESVLRQTYQNWQYVIVNNCSTDHTLEIAQHYAQQDARIRIHNNEEFLALMPNWNHALRQISSESKYCKVVHADDWLFSECLAKMVNVAEKNPSVGLISAYRLNGDLVDLDGLPYPSTVISGHEICRMSLLRRKFFIFGSPTSLLIRSDIIRNREAFYSAHIYADVEVCYNVLQETDFGFVHQVLTYTRLHDESQTSAHQKLRTNLLGRLTVLMKYGPVYLSQKEYEQRLAQRMESYYRFLGGSLLQRREKAFWDYHRQWLGDLGLTFSRLKLVKGLTRELYVQFINYMLHPKMTIRSMTGFVKKDGNEKNVVDEQAIATR